MERVRPIDVEEWRPVPGFPGYEVSSRGRVRSVSRIIAVVGQSPRVRQGQNLICRPGKVGYPTVVLGRGNRRLVHRLVLEAFVGPCPPGMEACHNDGTRTNNHVDNLRWGTRQENVLDRYHRHGRYLSLESCVKISRSRMGRVGHRHDADTRARIGVGIRRSWELRRLRKV